MTSTINRTAAYALIYLLSGKKTTADVANELSDVTLRSIQRAISRLLEIGIIEKKGRDNNPVYKINYRAVLQLRIAEKFLEDENRPISDFNYELVAWLNKLKPKELSSLGGGFELSRGPKMSASELERLIIELSWKSSALEGNTYSLLDTQLLLSQGLRAKNRTDFETQMIINHKDAVAFIIQNSELFGNNLKFGTVEELHRIIGYNLGIASGIRKKQVGVIASNYQPMDSPHQLREYADVILGIINRTTNPFTKCLLALALIPYLQLFEDGNKRTGRLLANAVLINSVGRGFSLRKTDARNLALAYLSFYEFNSLQALSALLKNELSPRP
ncbi:MAG TPA: Fic family protein [Candidatus Saccharimonadales bacterium]|nr:Fic family protein [Candidatus Saccharimonadales bacterium]